MFLLFFNLYLSMFTGSWQSLNYGDMTNRVSPIINIIGTFLTSIFGEQQYTTLGNIVSSSGISYSFIAVIAMVLATITSIGIVVMAGKGVKKAFGIFFMGIR